MKKPLLLFLLVFGFIALLHATPADEAQGFYFAVIDQPTLSRDIQLQAEIDRIRLQQLTFVVANGVRAEDEFCTDALYRERKNLLEESDKPLFLSLAGSDWIGCKNEDGSDIRLDRLRRLREILFENDTTFGMISMPLTRQSHIARYSDYPENTYWQQDTVLFATLNLPANNNHYLNAAGRNNEFEERLVANKYWLQRIFTLASRNHMDGIVLFCDGNPLESDSGKKAGTRDGFKEIRQLLGRLTDNFSGKVLVIHGEARQKKTAISWKNNLGVAAAGSTWLEIHVNPKSRHLFSVREPPAAKKKKVP
jgi:hypothetical protein